MFFKWSWPWCVPPQPCNSGLIGHLLTRRGWRATKEMKMEEDLFPISSWSHIQIKVCLSSGKALPSLTDQSEMKAIKAPILTVAWQSWNQRAVVVCVFIIVFNNAGRNWTMYWLCCFRALWGKTLQSKNAIRGPGGCWKSKALIIFEEKECAQQVLQHCRRFSRNVTQEEDSVTNNIHRWKIWIFQ